MVMHCTGNEGEWDILEVVCPSRDFKRNGEGGKKGEGEKGEG